MITDTLDLSFFGVASIWNNDLGRLPPMDEEHL